MKMMLVYSEFVTCRFHSTVEKRLSKSVESSENPRRVGNFRRGKHAFSDTTSDVLSLYRAAVYATK